MAREPKGYKAPGIGTFNNERTFPGVGTRPDMMARILDLYAQGKPTSQIFGKNGLANHNTFRKWLADPAQVALRAEYEVARKIRADFLFDQMLEIADDGTNDFVEGDGGEAKLNVDHIQRSKLRIDTRKYMLPRMSREYVEVARKEVSGVDGAPLEVNMVTAEQRRAALAKLLAARSTDE
jgi:hypothetical protein